MLPPRAEQRPRVVKPGLHSNRAVNRGGCRLQLGPSALATVPSLPVLGYEHKPPTQQAFCGTPCLPLANMLIIPAGPTPLSVNSLPRGESLLIVSYCLPVRASWCRPTNYFRSASRIPARP